MNITNSSYIFHNKRGCKFEISCDVVNQMLQFIQRLPGQSEAGGVMLGRYIIDSEDVVIDKITEPVSTDKQSRYHFFRSRYLHQEIITREWEASNGTCNYLGEWHTHPESNPHPSLTDQIEWKKKLIFDQFDSNFLYFVIVGEERINVWQGYRQTLITEKLKVS